MKLASFLQAGAPVIGSVDTTAGTILDLARRVSERGARINPAHCAPSFWRHESNIPPLLCCCLRQSMQS